MAQQTLEQTRVVEPILTTHARNYVRPGNIAKRLFPVVYVDAYGGQVIEFGRESFKLYNTRRAPGSDVKTIDIGYSGKPYAIIPSSLAAKVPRERLRDASRVPGIDLASEAVDTVMAATELEHEYVSAQIARNAANYDANHKLALTTTARWKSATSKPSQDVEAACQAIRSSIGVRGNTVALSASAFSALQFNASIMDKIKYTSIDSVTPQLLAHLWNVRNVIVGEAVVATGANDDFGDVWGDDVVVAYIPPSAGAGHRVNEPSYGYTYAIEGMPLVETPHYNNSNHSWIYGVSSDASPVLTSAVAGFLIQDAGAAP